MLALEPQNMLNMLAASNPMAYGFARPRRAATAAGFIVYCGILSASYLFSSRYSHHCDPPPFHPTLKRADRTCHRIFVEPPDPIRPIQSA